MIDDFKQQKPNWSHWKVDARKFSGKGLLVKKIKQNISMKEISTNATILIERVVLKKKFLK